MQESALKQVRYYILFFSKISENIEHRASIEEK